MRDKPRWEIIHGDSLTVLESFPPGTFDAVITDPPYASGGRTQAEKSKATAKKYSSMGGNAPPDFDGDAKDQRSWTRWAAEWLYLARRAAKPGAPVCMFIDWRQLPCASDALQWAGWIWRGIAVWDKGNSRPQKGRFRQQAEYIRLGFKRRYACQPPRAVPARCVQIWQSAEPHPPDREAVAAHAGPCQDHGTGRSYLGPLCRLRHDSSGCSQGRL